MSTGTHDQAKRATAPSATEAVTDRPQTRRYAVAAIASILLVLALFWLAVQMYALRASSDAEPNTHSDLGIAWLMAAGVILILVALGAIAFRVTLWSQDSANSPQDAPTSMGNSSA